MSPTVMFAGFIAVLWSAACLYIVVRMLRERRSSPIAVDQLFLTIALLSLALAPWTTLIAYHFSESKTLLGGSVNLAAAAVLFFASRRARAFRLDPSDTRHSVSTYRQKSAALMALTLAIIYIGYFILTWQTPALVVPLFFISAILLTAIVTVGHIGLALLHVPIADVDAPIDERDREAEHYSVRKAYIALAWGIWIVPAVALLQMPALVVANTALAFIVLAEIVKYSALVRFYRKGEI